MAFQSCVTCMLARCNRQEAEVGVRLVRALRGHLGLFLCHFGSWWKPFIRTWRGLVLRLQSNASKLEQECVLYRAASLNLQEQKNISFHPSFSRGGSHLCLI